MPIRMIWDDNDKTILRHIYEGNITSADVHQAVDENYFLQSQVSHHVYAITDLTCVASIGNILVSSIGGHTEKKVPPNQHMVVLVGANLFIKSLLRIGQTLAPLTTKNIHAVDTLNEAYQLIEQDKQNTTIMP